MAALVKGYRIDNRIYIFEDEAKPIPAQQIGVLPDVIYVERKLVDGFKEVEANADIADLIKGYNFQTMTINAKEWAGHEDDELEPVEEPKVSPELAWSANTATVTINADDNVYPTLTNPNSVTVAYTSSDTEKATIDASAGTVTLVAAGDTTISAVFEGNDTYEAQTVTYTLTVNADSVTPDPEPGE